MIQYILFEWI